MALFFDPLAFLVLQLLNPLARRDRKAATVFSVAADLLVQGLVAGFELLGFRVGEAFSMRASWRSWRALTLGGAWATSRPALRTAAANHGKVFHYSQHFPIQ